jgi:hypothetical protein
MFAASMHVLNIKVPGMRLGTAGGDIPADVPLYQNKQVVAVDLVPAGLKDTGIVLAQEA